MEIKNKTEDINGMSSKKKRMTVSFSVEEIPYKALRRFFRGRKVSFSKWINKVILDGYKQLEYGKKEEEEQKK